MLLPCLVFAALAVSPTLNFRTLLLRKRPPRPFRMRLIETAEWPVIVIALLAQLSSLGAGYLVRRYVSAPQWIVESLTFNE
jgi:hypothetical protein